MIKEKIRKIFLELSEEEKDTSILDDVFFTNQMKDREGKLKIKWSKVANNELVEIRKMFRGYHFPEHTHDYIEVMYILDGNIRQKILGKNLNLGAGQLLFLNPRISHEIFPAGKNDIAVKIFLNPDLFKSIYEFICIDDSINNFCLETIFEMDNEKAMLFNIGGIDEIEKLIYEIILDSLEQKKFMNNKLKLKVSLLLTELAIISDKMEEIKKSSFEEELILKTLSYVETSYKEGNLNEICKKLNVADYYISKLIRKNLNTTFKNLIHKKRLEKSVDLLLNSSKNITEISEHVGYKNWNYFYNLFRVKYGSTPNEYRKSYKKN